MPIDYTPRKGILTADEIIADLNLDPDYSQLDKLEALSAEASQFLFTKTGHDWSADEQVSTIAKGAARDYIFEIWYGDDDGHVSRRLENSLILLRSMVAEMEADADAGV